jgi:hypothetical protein
VSEEKNRSDLIGFCGLYCGDCHGFKGIIPDLARDLRKELRAAKYGKFANVIAELGFAKALGDYDKAYEVLGAMVKFRCRKGCRKGGGSPFCKIRICCQTKGCEGCWECGEFESCTELKFLERVHADGHLKNLRAIQKKGKKSFLSGKRYW